ncbi:MAG: TerB N-terminal domain-containing protein [Clostridia bacterium]|nr:TerB N-terminal domain-containing protein [Clostridia bacterium]
MGKENEDSFWDIEELLPHPPAKKAKRLGGAYDTDAVSVEIGAAPAREGEAIPARTNRVQTAVPSPVRTGAYTPAWGLIRHVEICEWPSAFTFYEKFRRDALRFFARHGEPCEYVYFFAYMPQYDQMTVSQLGYYLYWRDCVRRGEYPKTDINYLFLYIYEIINLPDRIPAQEGVALLSRLWGAYRDSFPYLDKYLGEWICDYCLIHRVEPLWEIVDTFSGEVAGKVSMPEFYLRDGMSWGVIESLATYDYRESKFYEPNREAYDRHIPLAAERAVQRHILPHLADYGVECVRVMRDSFAGAVSYRGVKCKIAVQCMPLRRSPDLKKAMTGVIKLCENALRAAFGIKSRFSPNGVPQLVKDEITAYFDAVYPRATKKKGESEEEAYMALYEPENNGPADIGRAMKIEEAAWEITELLGTDEADEAELAPPVTPSAPSDEPTLAMTARFDTDAQDDDFAFVSAMAGFLREALSAAADGTLEAFCRERGKLAHTVCAELNELAMDAFGDMIVQEEDFSLVPDYAEQIREALEGS